MKLFGRESLIAALLTAACMPINGEEEPEKKAEECSPVHESLKSVGANEFSKLLMNRAMDFKYGEFTIFAPPDKLLKREVLVLKDAGQEDATTINDIVLFHVSAANVSENIAENCGDSLLMLNEELHVDQESSITECKDGSVFQVGPGNVEDLPKVVGDPVHACNAVIYSIEDALMLPSLPDVVVTPTEAPEPTKPPTRQDDPVAPTAAPEPADPPDSAANTLEDSLAFFTFAAIIISMF